MFDAIEIKCQKDIEVVSLLIDIHNQELENHSSSIRQKIREYTVSSCVTRLYAIVENFIETIISDYLDALSELVRFSSLPVELKNEYRIGISYILSKIEQGRFDHLNHENVVEWYYIAIKDSDNYRFITDALTRHEQNFRLNIIESAFNKVQLKDFSSWVCKYPKIVALYADHSSVHEQLESEIKGFVQLRNDASHGTMDNLEGDDNLKRLCELNSAMINAISSFMRKSLILKRLDVGRLFEAGKVTEVFQENDAFVAKFKNGVVLKKGERLMILEQSDCYYERIESLMDNDTSVNEISITIDNYEVGVKLSKQVKNNARIFNLINNLS
jgi:hypothetical protein